MASNCLYTTVNEGRILGSIFQHWSIILYLNMVTKHTAINVALNTFGHAYNASAQWSGLGSLWPVCSSSLICSGWACG